MDKTQEKIRDIVYELKYEYLSAKRSHDDEWVNEVLLRLDQMKYICEQTGVDYGKDV